MIDNYYLKNAELEESESLIWQIFTAMLDQYGAYSVMAMLRKV